MADTKGEATKEAILQRAMVDFRLHGYEGTALSEIAGQLGISRAAVLHHYGSKSELLHAVVDPYLDALLEMVVRHESTGTLTLLDRRAVINEFLDLCLANVGAAGILSWDITSRHEASIAERQRDIGERVYALIVGSDASPADQIVARAALAVVVRPLTDPSIDSHDPQTRMVLLLVVNAVIDQFSVEAGRRHSD